MNIGIMGTGSIAATMAATISKMENAVLYAAASRAVERAEKFADIHGVKRFYGSYEELVKDENVELIYIATPHSEHFENTMLCIENGKPVLCEKAFTVNAEEARKLKSAAYKNNVFLAEAIWTRYMPSRKIIDDLLCILDIGIYGINFAVMHFGKDIERIDSSVKMTDTGVDGRESITIHFKSGKMAVLTHSIYCRSDRKGIFHGDKGYIVVENINDPSEISVYDTNDELIRHMYVPEQISGYEYEVYEAMECIKNGRTESLSMPLDESVFMMEVMDGIRRDWGLVYPKEKKRYCSTN